MRPKSSWQPRIRSMLVVAPASPYTWAVAFSRQLIPGAVFSTQGAAVVYAMVLARAAGLDTSSVRILAAV